MVISPRTAHSFRVLVIRYDIVIVGELFSGRWRISCPAPQSSGSEAYASLLATGVFDILAVVRIFDPLHSTSYQPRFGNEFPEIRLDGVSWQFSWNASLTLRSG